MPSKYSAPLLTLLHLWMHIKCGLELILWGNDPAKHSIIRKHYNSIQSGNRCSPDTAYYHSHLHRCCCSRSIIQIRFNPNVSSLSLSFSFKFTWVGCCGYSSWFNDMNTQSLLNKSSSLCLHTHSAHLFFSPEHLFVFSSHSHYVCMSNFICLCLFLSSPLQCSNNILYKSQWVTYCLMISVYRVVLLHYL